MSFLNYIHSVVLVTGIDIYYQAMLFFFSVLESSEWPSVGIFSGTRYHLGNFDECTKISAYNIRGQYCLAEATYHYPDTLQNEVVEEPDEKISAWDALTMVFVLLLLFPTYEQINRLKIQFEPICGTLGSKN